MMEMDSLCALFWVAGLCLGGFLGWWARSANDKSAHWQDEAQRWKDEAARNLETESHIVRMRSATNVAAQNRRKKAP